MRKARLRQNIVRKAVFTLAGIFLVLSNSVFAEPISKIDGKGEGNKKQKTTKSLTTDELALFEKLEKEHQQELKSIKTTAFETTNYKRVLVYDMAGNLLQEQDGQKAKIDLNKLPKKAKLLTVSDDLAIYIVL